LVITGSETDVCVLGTVLGAVDFSYRVIIVEMRFAVHQTKVTMR
jgi:nicotinamidase-related amidase